MKYAIARTKENVTKYVHVCPDLQSALDILYNKARKHGYTLEIDNTPDGRFGFCFWQIGVTVNEWRYTVYAYEQEEF